MLLVVAVADRHLTDATIWLRAGPAVPMKVA
jgi:hypothetical protein